MIPRHDPSMVDNLACKSMSCFKENRAYKYIVRPYTCGQTTKASTSRLLQLPDVFLGSFCQYKIIN
jgi:hypothetical protein